MTTEVVRGRVITGQADLPSAEIVVEGDRVVAVRPVADVPRDVIVLPGLVDAHCHGGGGASLTSGDADQVRAAASHHLSQGTTSLIGSAVTDDPARMLAVTRTLAAAVDDGLLAGIHLEGPFLSAARCGAQDPAHLVAPDLELAERLLAAGRGHVRVMTVAPELPGAAELAALLRTRGVVVAVGHTDADAVTTQGFLGLPGVDLVTHLFNGMPPLHHRAPGAVGGALAAAAAGHARVELIADGVHLADDTVALVLGLIGRGRVLLVSDAMAAAGQGDGDYQLGPQRVVVRDGVARLAEGRSIAGGTTRLMDQVRRHVTGGLDPVTVVAAATIVPATALDLTDVGGLTPGLRADLVVTDAGWHPQRVMRAGEWVA